MRRFLATRNWQKSLPMERGCGIYWMWKRRWLWCRENLASFRPMSRKKLLLGHQRWRLISRRCKPAWNGPAYPSSSWLRQQVGPEAADYAHATTQDIIDTALVLQIRDALAVIEPMLAGVIKNLAGLAGRTHSQQALPVTFGLKVAGWLSLVSGSLAKMAQGIILMAQTKVGELRESADVAWGGSSTMPQKSNPIISEVIIAAHRINASLLTATHQALVQEHERATYGWQIEWLILPQMFALTGAARVAYWRG